MAPKISTVRVVITWGNGLCRTVLLRFPDRPIPPRQGKLRGPLESTVLPDGSVLKVRWSLHPDKNGSVGKFGSPNRPGGVTGGSSVPERTWKASSDDVRSTRRDRARIPRRMSEAAPGPATEGD